MAIRELYFHLLEKAASAKDGPDYSVDSAAVAREEHKANRQDTRATLSGLFDQAKSSEQENTRLLDKALPNGPRETSMPLMKLASQVLHGQRGGLPFLKTASPAYLQVLLHGLRDEIEQINR
jgi:hypothetical protein